MTIRYQHTTEPTLETSCTLNTPQTMENVHHNSGIMKQLLPHSFRR